MSAHNVEDVYGLSPLQFGMLFHSLEDSSDTRPYLVQMTEEISGAFDDDCFRDAWQQLIDRHPILRSAFIWEGVSEPVQVVQRTAKLPYERQDLRGLPAEAQEARLAEFLAADWERGFDLTRAPLVRVASLRMDDERRIVVWSFHHILLDGWSIQILQQELLTLYRGLLTGRPAQLPPALPYRRYIEWLNSQSPADSKAFWTDYLSGVTEPTDLHVDRATGETGIGEIEVVAEEELFTAARGYARTQRITMNTLVQGLWAILLSRYSGQDDVLFGSTISGRSIELPGVESMMGLFINTLPVRGRVAGEQPVAEWLRALQDEQLDMRQWEYCHLVDVREYSQIPRGEPLFRSILVFENYPVLQEAADIPAEMTSRLVNCVERTGYPLTLVASAGRALEFRFVHDRAFFDDATVRRLVGHFQTLLASVVGGRPETRLSELEMLTAAERQQIVIDWNATQGPYPDTATIHSLIEERSEREPDAIALTHGDVSLTYRQVNEQANQLAHHLRTINGITPDTLIAVCLDRSPELITTLLGILKAGAAFIPLDPDYPTDRITYMIQDTATPLVITHTDHAHRLPTGTPLLLVDHNWPSTEATHNPTPVATPDHLAYVIYTSGSTGRPKGVQLDHRGVVNYLHWCDLNYPTQSANGIGTLLYSSVTFDLTITALFLPLIQGQQLTIPTPTPDQSAFDAAIDLILTGTPISFLKATPSHLEVLTAQLELANAKHNIATIVAGGEDLSPTLANRILTTGTGHTVIANEYGATEGSVANVMSLTTTIDPTYPTSSVGVPITNTTAYVVDRFNHPVPIGVPGECLLGGICVARGYLNRPELTTTRFIPDPFNTTDPTARAYRTGDLVRLRPNGEMEFIGRIDNQVKLRGYRIELGEIENNLAAHPAISATTVVVRQDTPGDKRLVAYLVPAGAATPTTTELRTHLQQHLPDYMVPTTYITLDHLPLTPNGKVDQKALPAPDHHRPDLAATYTAPRTPVEEAIAAVWSAVLGVATVGVHDNFFELGGQSINAVRVASRISEAGWRVTLQQIMRHATIAELAAAITAPQQATAGLIVRLSEGPVTDLPRLFCVHPGGGSTHSYRELAARLADSYDVYGVQAAGLNPGEEPITGIEAMAARYWAEIRSVQPQGPCLLLGWSTGAVVVHELCVQRPDEVQAAFLLEPAVTGPEQRERFERYSEVYRQVDALWQQGQGQSGPARAGTERALKELAPRMNIEVEAVTLDEWLPYAVLEAEVRSLAAYRPGRAFTRATLFVSESVRAAGPEGTEDEVGPARYTAHWQQRYPAGLEILEMPGRHLRMVKGEEQLEALVSAIEKLRAHS
ncbi:amino acid adenylation domain-containing protein [Kitasatospora sp. NBC_01287]|uniref:amino acid adenylation domain-containing protein n=1 Tax=Kitasatospora sp. NBC_01287 TaxID=2903573 RepID=UPI00225453C2|nr:amino acid adenylation domain-containing protein [Kitasatospora sp. NBC_01287]MCX4744334.1 amino acid adenylation domain-containing protein [Kitasatospora sp. NBC_01287]